MDKDRNYFKATIYIHPESDIEFDRIEKIEALTLTDLEQSILESCQYEPKTYLEFSREITNYRKEELEKSILALEEKKLIKSKEIRKELIYFIAQEGLNALKLHSDFLNNLY